MIDIPNVEFIEHLAQDSPTRHSIHGITTEGSLADKAAFSKSLGRTRC